MSEVTDNRSDDRAAQRPWVVDLLIQMLAAFAITVAVGVALAGATLLAASDARAQEPSLDPSDARSGTLLLRSKDDAVDVFLGLTEGSAHGICAGDVGRHVLIAGARINQ